MAENKTYEYEVAVIGAGPGGYETAIKAAQMGKKTCIIESTYFGGTCLNVGCIPTKALIRTAELYSEIKEADHFAIEGVDLSKVSVNMKKLQQRKNTVVKTLVGGVKGLLRGNKVTVIEGKASFVDAHTLAVGDKKVTAQNVIIATGSSVFMPPFIAQEGKNNILTSTEALDLDHVPGTVAVIGGGVIGVEFAFLLGKLGSKVTVLELMAWYKEMQQYQMNQVTDTMKEKLLKATDMIAAEGLAEETALYASNDIVTDEELNQALKTACAYNFVHRIPTGLASPVKEKGGGFSEGQIQRLSIARAMLSDAPILLLDEATSALDVETEQTVIRNLMEARENRTCIITTHRPSVLEICDRVYCIKDGKIEIKNRKKC